MTLTEFLTARLDEDAAFARTALEMASRVTDDQLFTAENMAFARRLFGQALSTPGVVETVEKYEGAHSAPTSPARVLADVDAKRMILLRYETVVLAARSQTAIDCYTNVLEDLALPYADHPDYDEAWRP